ncbi:MAG: hypothetical protein M3347_15880, partial [Armatimonadota bacterium]|nr:hypothetical protein [Armatimonadota bacterium]
MNDKMISNGRIKFQFLTLALTVLAIQILLVLPGHSSAAQKQPIEAETRSGRAPRNSQGNYTGDKVPGDPANGIQVLQRVYQFIKIYRDKHQGAY